MPSGAVEAVAAWPARVRLPAPLVPAGSNPAGKSCELIDLDVWHRFVQVWSTATRIAFAPLVKLPLCVCPVVAGGDADCLAGAAVALFGASLLIA